MVAEPGAGVSLDAVVRRVQPGAQTFQPRVSSGNIFAFDHEQRFVAAAQRLQAFGVIHASVGVATPPATHATPPSTPAPTATRRGPSIRSRSQWRRGAVLRGGRICRCRQRIALTSAAMPDAAPAWPTSPSAPSSVSRGAASRHVLDDRVDRVAVAHGVVEALQHDRRRPFSRRAAVGAGREQGTHVAGQIDRPGQGRVEFAALQRPHRRGHGAAIRTFPRWKG